MMEMMIIVLGSAMKSTYVCYALLDSMDGALNETA